MGRSPCCNDNSGLKKGPWTPEEDEKLTSFIQKHGHGSWRALPRAAGLNRCGKSCRLRWTNYLRPDIKRGPFSQEEEDLIIKLHSVLGNKWSRIAAHLPGRTDNEIKNYWNTHLRKKLLQMGIDPITHKPRTDLNFLSNLTQLLSSSRNHGSLNPLDNININITNALRLQPNIAELAKLQVLQNIFQILNTSSPIPSMDQTTASNLGFPNVSNVGNINQAMCSTSQLQGDFCQIPNYVSGISQTQGDKLDGNNLESWPSLETSNNNGNKRSLSSSYNNNTLDENRLPSLVTLSNEASTINQTESNTNSTNGSALTPTGGALFASWEKLLDDGNSDSFWKQFLN